MFWQFCCAGGFLTGSDLVPSSAVLGPRGLFPMVDIEEAWSSISNGGVSASGEAVRWWVESQQVVLSNEELSRLWRAADVEDSGSLTATGFVGDSQV